MILGLPNPKKLLRRLASFSVFLILLGNLQAYAQEGYAFRQKRIFAGQAEHTLDTLSIFGASFFIYGPDGQLLDPAFFRFDAMSTRLSLRIPEYWRNDSLEVHYRVFPLLLTAPYFHKDPTMLLDAGAAASPVPLRLGLSAPDQGLLSVGGLQSAGSITRGITLGNRQDLSLQSAMNLQLSGNLSDDIEINAVISDQDIPFQPDGTTRQIQDFDKVFIQLSGLGGQLVAGDFELERPDGHFMNFSRKAQGGMGSYITRAHGNGLLGGAEVQITAAGAIAKGKYVRNQLTAIEGNQGPYKLIGASNESYIVVLAGTERVFIDGVLITRGMDHDYVIDYNMAEVTFTSRRIITKDARIVVEFEYAERNYARSVLFTGTQIKTEKAGLRINFFSEQDHKNQSLFQELTDERISRMAGVGDSLQLAFDWNVDSTGFFNDRVMYLMTDSLGYDSVFVFSTDPERAFYRVGFSFVGQGAGNYIQVNSAANGRVFQWIEPVNGQPQGTHEPIIQLVTPKKMQMLSIGADYQVSPLTNAGVEFALSNNDINLFSDFDKSNDLGYGLLFRVNNKTPLPAWGDGKWNLFIAGTHEMASGNFNPIERYRPIEFERDWNLEGSSEPVSEHYTNISLQLANPQSGSARYWFNSFQKGTAYSGFMNKADARLKVGEFKLFYDGSLLNSTGIQRTDFYRHKAGLSRPLLFFVTGLEHQMEDNRRMQEGADSLLASSAFFDEWLFFVSNPDTTRNRYRLFHKIRNDRRPLANGFVNESQAKEVGLTYEFLSNPDQRLLLNLTHRSLSPPDNQVENTMGGRFNYFSRWAKGVVVSAMFYETGSGMERKREYIYLEVPAGQGVYTWIDYNGNGVMELDEFETAQFPDQANFIRVFVPTDDFTRVFSTSYSHTLTLDPRVAWRDNTGIKAFIARFSNQTSLRIDKKNQGEASTRNFNPFFSNVTDSMLVALNSSFRNTLFFNRSSSIFFMELTWLDNRNKMLLSNGFETRVMNSTGLRARWNFNRRYSFEMKASLGKKESKADFFQNRNYNINAVDFEPSLSYQYENRWRVNLFYGFSNKENMMGVEKEKASIHKTGLELRYIIPAKGNLSGRYQLSQIDYPFETNTPVAFEMLEGLNAGTNSIWNLSWQQNLNAWLQLNLGYHGRKSPGSPAVHSGSMQVRALF